MIELTPEQQIRDIIARTGLTPQEFATAYSNLTPGEVKLAGKVASLERQLETSRKALEAAKECIEANRHNALRLTETMTFCGDCGQSAPHCAEDSQFPGAGDACSIKHSEGCAMALQWRTSETVDAALRSLSEPAAPHPDTEGPEQVPTASELYDSDGTAAGIWYCLKCRIVHQSQMEAERCHGDHLCACGASLKGKPYYKTSCDECDNKAWRERTEREELERYQKANRVPESQWKGEQVFYGDRYYADIKEILDDHPEVAPEYVWTAKNVGAPRASISDITEHMLEEMWEDADECDLNGVAELEAALKVFNEANSSIVCWMVDYSTAIVLEARNG